MAKKKASKKQKLDIKKLVLMAIVLVGAVLMILPLFLNVWNWVVVSPNLIKEGVTTSVSELGGYFVDTEGVAKIFTQAESTFMGWASIVAGITLIVALVGAVGYFASSILSKLNIGGDLSKKLVKFSSIIMVLAGLVIIVMTLLFAIPSVETVLIRTTYSVGLGIGAWFGMIAPIVAGVAGYLSTKK